MGLESEAFDNMMLQRSEERKIIAKELQLLQVTKDTAIQETKKIIEAADQSTQRLNDILLKIIQISSIHKNVSRETMDFIDNCNSHIQNVTIKIREMDDWSQAVTSQLKKSDEEVKLLEIKASNIHDSIVTEEAIMQQKRNDLDIYHARLKEYFKKYLPTQKIRI